MCTGRCMDTFCSECASEFFLNYIKCENEICVCSCPVLLWLAVRHIHCTPHTNYVPPIRIYVVYDIAIAWYNKDNYLTASTQREYGAEFYDRLMIPDIEQLTYQTVFAISCQTVISSNWFPSLDTSLIYSQN
jgi:hypothetical protein